MDGGEGEGELGKKGGRGFEKKYEGEGVGCEFGRYFG